jgi:hypothetical protein
LAWWTLWRFATQLTRRVADAQMGVDYTNSKAIDWADNEITKTPMWNRSRVMGRNRALASYALTSNFDIWSICRSPLGHGQYYAQRGVGAAILGRWEIARALAKTSGTPFSISSSGASLDAPGNSQTADQVVSKVAILRGHWPNSPYFDPNAFVPVTPVRFGTSGKNFVRGPGMSIMNLGLIRDFELTENLNLQFLAESYSWTNTPDYGNSGSTLSDATFSGNQLTSSESMIARQPGSVRYGLR